MHQNVLCDAAAVDTRDSLSVQNELTSAKISRQNDGWICDPRAGRGHGNHPTTDLLRHPMRQRSGSDTQERAEEEDRYAN